MIKLWDLSLITGETADTYRGIDSSELLRRISNVCSDPNPDRFLVSFGPADGIARTLDAGGRVATAKLDVEIGEGGE